MNKLNLPIDPYLEEVYQKSTFNQPLLLKSAPGTGKTTRAPAYFFLKKEKQNNKKIIVLLPKRVSVISAAKRVCEENNWTLGNEVGYAVRFESQLSSATGLIFMTDGLFLKKMTSPHFLNNIEAVFLDEFHERRINQDLILAQMIEHNILNDPIKIIIMSATIEFNSLKDYFNQFTGHQEIQINNKHFEIEKIYLDKQQRLNLDNDFYENLVKTLHVAKNKSQKDILIFLPGLKEIQKAADKIKVFSTAFEICILHGSLHLEEQKRILNKSNSHRRIILATNIAESSITLPDLDCVIDSGLEKYVHFEKKIGFSKLNIRRISSFSAQQREGRAGRIKNGYCFKLWHPIDERSMPEQIEPEIFKSPLEETLLFLSSSGVENFESFSWLTSPPLQQIRMAREKLFLWKLIDRNNRITVLGKFIIESPLNIELTLILLELLKCKNLNKELIISLVCRLENLPSDNLTTGSPLENDLNRILEIPLNESTKKLIKNVESYLSPYKVLSTYDRNLPEALFYIFTEYFPEKIISKKSGSTGLSSLGRGVELSSKSAALKSDFYIALSGYEKNDAITFIDYAVGLSKLETLKILQQLAQTKKNIFFDEIQSHFYTQEVLLYGNIILNEKSKTILKSSEINDHWKSYVLDNPETFLKLNPTYELNLNKLLFLNLKKDLFENLNFYLPDNFSDLLIKKMTDYISDFETFKSCDIKHFISEIIPAEVNILFVNLPDNLKLPSGRIAIINYTDPKAPLVSAKIQDFFGWNTHPTLFNGKIKFTIELLAPNMRPTQITNDLANFWTNSYLEIRKDLRARYPKHSWPEKPEMFNSN